MGKLDMVVVGDQGASSAPFLTLISSGPTTLPLVQEMLEVSTQMVKWNLHIRWVTFGPSIRRPFLYLPFHRSEAPGALG